MLSLALMSYSVSAAGITTKVTNDSIIQVNPDISGSNVIWQNYPNGPIFLYNIWDKVQTQVSDDGVQSSQFLNPRIVGNYIYWLDNRYGKAINGYLTDLYMYDIAQKTTTRITSEPMYIAFDSWENDHPPIQVSGKYIVWSDEHIKYYSGISQVYLYNTQTKQLIQITQGGGRDPIISGNLIVYENNGDIYLYEIKAKGK